MIAADQAQLAKYGLGDYTTVIVENGEYIGFSLLKLLKLLDRLERAEEELARVAPILAARGLAGYQLRVSGPGV